MAKLTLYIVATDISEKLVESRISILVLPRWVFCCDPVRHVVTPQLVVLEKISLKSIMIRIYIILTVNESWKSSLNKVNRGGCHYPTLTKSHIFRKGVYILQRLILIYSCCNKVCVFQKDLFILKRLVHTYICIAKNSVSWAVESLTKWWFVCPWLDSNNQAGQCQKVTNCRGIH